MNYSQLLSYHPIMIIVSVRYYYLNRFSGLGKEISDKLVGSHWTMTLWKDGDILWGVHFIWYSFKSFRKNNFGRTYLGKSVNYMTYFSRGNSEFGAPEVRLRGPGKE